MSNSNGINTLARSINGIITYADGSGTLIQNGKIITITLTANIITALKLFINNIDCNGILQIGSVTTTQIYISPAGRLVLGSSTCLNTFIQQNDSLLVGQSPETYDSDSKLMNAPNMRFENTNGQSLIDFHSNTVGSRTPDSRIIATGGGGSALSGTLALSSGNIYISSGDTTNISDNTTNINNINTNINSVNNINLTAASIIVSGQLNVISPVAYIAKQGFNNLEIGSAGVGSGDTYLNFHSSGNNINYDSKIVSTGGGATIGGATLSLIASAVKMDTILPYTSGNTIELGDKTISSIYGVRLQGQRSALAYYQASTGQDYPTFIECASSSSNNTIDFHCTGTLSGNYDARISCDSATGPGINTATMSLLAKILNLNALSTININPVGNLTMGSSTSANTFIQNSDGLIIGTDPTSYTPSNGKMTAPGLRFQNKAGLSLIDFHSNTTGAITDPDSRIISQGGSATAYGGTLEIKSGTISMIGTTTANITAPTINITGKVDMVTTSLITLSTTQAVNITGTTGVNILAGGDINITNAGTVNLKGPNNCYLEVANGAGNSLLDFHSNSTYNDYDARIMCNTSGSGVGTGILSYSARRHYFGGGLYANNGLAFSQGTFASPQLMTSGGFTNSINLGANSANSTYVSFGVTFAAGPYITLAGYANVAASMGVVVTFHNTSTTGFTVNFYNSRSVTAPANTYGLHWIATGNTG
jgi:hypothetical protein